MNLFKRVRIIHIDPKNPQPKEIAAAAEVLRSGGLVVFPTETVYGLGANLFNEEAVERVYAVKNRPKDKPLTVHVARVDTVREMSLISVVAQRLMDRFWPGPLTIVLNSKDGGKMGFRMPANKVALSLIEESNVPVVAPSANLSGKTPPTNVKEVLDNLNDNIDMILDAGPTEIGIESTVVDASIFPFKILREGAIHKSALKDAWRHGREED